MADYISRDAAYQAIEAIDENAGARGSGFTDPDRIMRDSAFYALDAVKPADVVSRDCYDRILAENDAMREILAQIWKKTGDKMDDVRKMVTCEECDWHVDCGYHYCNKWCHPCPDNAEFFCAYGERTNCGADMREVEP